MHTLASAWRVHYKLSTRLVSIWQVLITSSKIVHARVVLVMTFSCICIVMWVHLMYIRALHKQGVIRVLENLSQVAQ